MWLFWDTLRRLVKHISGCSLPWRWCLVLGPFLSGSLSFCFLATMKRETFFFLSFSAWEPAHHGLINKSHPLFIFSFFLYFFSLTCIYQVFCCNKGKWLIQSQYPQISECSNYPVYIIRWASMVMGRYLGLLKMLIW